MKIRHAVLKNLNGNETLTTWLDIRPGLKPGAVVSLKDFKPEDKWVVEQLFPQEHEAADFAFHRQWYMEEERGRDREEELREARIALLAKIANTEGWEGPTAYVYCTEPEIHMSPNEFDAIRHNYPNLCIPSEER